MHGEGFALFETAIGTCAIAWSPRGITGARLPDRDPDMLRARMHRRYPKLVESEPPSEVAAAIEGICAVLRGEPLPLSEIVLDMTGVPEFDRRVYHVARAIPPGTTLSYGEIATTLGEGTLARDVGQALGNNPFPPIVPCHRVVSADGRMHGFSASGGVAMKLRMLKNEGWRAGELSLFDFG